VLGWPGWVYKTLFLWSSGALRGGINLSGTSKLTTLHPEIASGVRGVLDLRMASGDSELA
jgi:hypothetical protein